jgi:glycosyltransferase involved in cell wall biosynthesis
MSVSITVAIPTHNRRETLLMAIESAILQSRPPMQVIVVADGCTDGTPEAVKGLGDDRVQVLDLPKRPGFGYGNRNEALSSARGDVVAWLGDDDLYLPDHLELLGELFDNQELDMVQALACIVHEDDRLEPLGMDWRVPYYRQLMLAGDSRTPMAGVSHRPGLAMKVGGWSDQWPRKGDMRLWQAMLRAGARSAMIDRPTVLHFRAWRRRQPYHVRVAQNRQYLDRIRSPGGVTGIRSAITFEMQSRAAVAENSEANFRRYAEQARRHLEDAEARLADQWEELERLSQRDALLTAIQSGGWWRLHERILPAIRAFSWLRGVWRSRTKG